MILQMENISTSTTWERAQQLFNKNIELDNKRQKSRQARIPSDPNIFHQKRENYEAIILEDHAFSEQHKIEISLWLLHYKRIEEFRALLSAAPPSATNNNRAPLQPDRRTKIRVQFKAFLSETSGFYHDLIIKIRAKYGLPLGNFSDESNNMAVVGNNAVKSSDVKKGLESCHRCLIYLGDLARYKGLYGEAESKAREFSAASSYYLQAASLLPSNGNAHHQLAILSTYSGDELVVVYRYFRSVAAEVPILQAKNNLVTAFEKNRQSYTKLYEVTKTTENTEVMKEKYRDFCIRFVRLHGILFSGTSLETFSDVRSSVTEILHELLSSGPEERQNFGEDSMENGLTILRLAAMLIYTVDNVNRRNEGQTYTEILQRNILIENACTVTFELMGLIVQRCLELHDPSSSFLLPGILVFLEWLACYPNVATCSMDEKKTATAKMSFWKHCIDLLNKLVLSRIGSVDDDGDETCFTKMSRYEEGETDSRLALWEDFELRGFSPLRPAQSILEFSRKHSPGVGGINKQRCTRVKRIISAGKALASVAMVDQKPVSFDSIVKQFIIGAPPQGSENCLWETATPSVNSQMTGGNLQLGFDGEDGDEDIVFKPVVVEKQMDAMGMIQNFAEGPNKGKTVSPLPRVRFNEVTSERGMPNFDKISDLPNSTWMTEQQASVSDGIKKLRFVEDGLGSSTYVTGNLGVNSSSLFPPQPSVGFIPSNMNSVAFPEGFSENLEVKPPAISASFNTQAGRPVRHLGPPPGFSHVPLKSVNMPVSNGVGSNGSMKVGDYSWFDGLQPPLTSSLGTGYPTNQRSQGTNPVLSNNGGLNGHSSLPFSGMQSSGVQLQGGGNLRSHLELQSFRNMHPILGQKLLEQQHVMAENQFGSQGEGYQGQPTWTGRYRV